MIERYGFSDDPTYDTLLNKLASLAGEWRQSKSDEIAEQYRTILQTLLMLGWHEPLDPDIELPDRLMPQVYLNQFE